MTISRYQITSELKGVLDLLANQPPPVLFVTGSAGTGKSTLIQIIRQQLKKNLAVVAPTGVAALRVGGQTIHTFFRFPPKPQPSPRRLHGESRRIIDGMDLLVIDEVSMVRADLLDAIDASLRRNTESGNMPFGGKTVLLIGDLHQLPPRGRHRGGRASISRALRLAFLLQRRVLSSYPTRDQNSFEAISTDGRHIH